MPAVPPSEARYLIEQTFNDFTRFLQRNKHLARDPKTPYTFTSILMDLKDWESSVKSTDTMNYLFKDLSAEGYNYLLEQCLELAEIYQLPTRGRLKGISVLKKAEVQDKKIKKLVTQVKKFGDEQIAKRFTETETGNSIITFEAMDDLTEGYTKIEDGKIKYCLNKKYERITSEEDLWRASIILAHELQRNPETGDLRGETAEVVQNDIKFIEQLANEYGDKVYELNPDFLVMHYVREMFGDEGVKAFADTVFSREGPYWKISGSFRDFLSAFNPRFVEQPALVFNAVIMEASRGLQSMGRVIIETLHIVREEVSRFVLVELQNAIDSAIIAVQDEIKRIYMASTGRGTYKLFSVKDKGLRGVNATLELVVESTRDGELRYMLIAGVSRFRQKPTKIGIIEISAGLRQTFDLSLIPDSLRTNFLQKGGGSILGFIRDTMTTMGLAIDAKLSWVVADVGILIRRDLFDFSNRNIQLAYERLLDGWVAGVQFTIGNKKFEWRVNVSDWLQDR